MFYAVLGRLLPFQVRKQHLERQEAVFSMTTYHVAEPRASYGYIDPCYYCGLPATCVDHVIPVVMWANLATLEDAEMLDAFVARHRVRTVPACRECNSLLGSKYFDTLAKRRQYVQDQLAQRYRDVLATPAWTDSELGQLSDRMRNYVLEGLNEQRIVRQRLAWSQGHNPKTINQQDVTPATARQLMQKRRRSG